VTWVQEGQGTGVAETAAPDATVRYTGAAVEVKAP